MTTYSLRSASPAKTRADAVVVGVVAGDKGPRLCDAADDVTKAYGRRLRPFLSTMGVTGKAGEAVKAPTRDEVNAPLLVFVGLGDDPTDPVAVRRAAGVAARSVPNAASVALALPSDTPELVAAVVEGHRLGGYTFTAYKSQKTETTEPADVVVLSRDRPPRRGGRRPRARGGPGRRRRADPRLGQHAARATALPRCWPTW